MQRSLRPWHSPASRIMVYSLAILLLAVAGGKPLDEAAPSSDAPATATASGDVGSAAGPAVVPGYRQADQVAVLRVEGVIDRITLYSLERRVASAVADGATAVVLDIDTPGGELYAALDICHLLKTEAPANTVAWVNPRAYSAGTIIALAAREIVVQENSFFGDAAPIAVLPFVGMQPLPPEERAKIESPILEEVVDSARRNGYDENIVQAFVSAGIELWLVENIQTGEKIAIDREEYTAVFGEDPPSEMTSITPPGQRIMPRVELEASGEMPAPPTIARDRLTRDDRGQYRPVRQIISADRLLTLRPAEAKFYGLAQTIIRNDEELREYFGARTIVRYDPMWSEGLARFLTSLPVRAVLIVVFLVCLFIELSAPGVGIFGATAAAALVLLLGAPALVGMAQWWGILLILLGLLLIGVELFILPGLGIAGVSGLLALLIGLVGTFVTGDLGTMQGRFDLWATLTTTLLSVLAAGVLIWLISRQIHSLPLLDRLILKAELGNQAAASREPTLIEAMEPSPLKRIVTGDLGVAQTDLRPNGRALVDGRMIDVQSVEGFIEKGTPLRIVSVGRFVTEVEAANE